MAKKFIGAVVYRGASMFDGAPIVAIATGFNGSDNPKTGAGLIQVYILRADIDPTLATVTGADSAICGDCVHRGKYDSEGKLIPSTRSCYVVTFRAPRVVYGGLIRGAYDDYANASRAALSKLFRHRQIRLGAYGDPAAVPFATWESIMAQSNGGTGYTHAWRRFPELSQWCMASVDSDAERVQAKALGFRTFRVTQTGELSTERNEVLCPASVEAGKKTTCDACRACGGTNAKARADIYIPAHGYGALAVSRRVMVTA